MIVKSLSDPAHSAGDLLADHGLSVCY